MEAALVIKGRDGKTLFVQSRGLDVRQASQAAQEAMTTLATAAQPGAADPWDVVSSTQGLPLLCGRLEVMSHRLSVTYRVAGGLVLLVVAPPRANPFAAVALANAAVRLLAGAGGAGGEGGGGGRAPDLTPERLMRRFGEVYLAVEALLGSGGVLGAAGAAARARAALEALGEKGDKGDKEGRDKGGAKSPEAPRTPPREGAAVAPPTRRTLQGAIDQLQRLAFHGGPGLAAAAVPRPGFQLPDGAAGPAGPAAGRAGQDPFAAGGAAFGAAAGAAAAADAFGEDDIFGLGGKAPAKPAAAAPAKGPTGLDALDPFAASEAVAPDWTAFGAEGKGKEKAKEAGAQAKAADMGFEDNAFGPAAAAAAAPPAPPAPPSPPEPALCLVEEWRAEVAGPGAVRAGLAGRVGWASDSLRARVHTVGFMIMVPDGGPGALPAALGVALRHPAACRPAPPPPAAPGAPPHPAPAGLLVADGIAARAAPAAPLLRYRLPAAACAPPLRVRLGASTAALPAAAEGERGGGLLVTLGLHVAAGPAVAARAAGLRAELALPALLGAPLRAAPHGGTYDATARSLTWEWDKDAGRDKSAGASGWAAAALAGGEGALLVACFAVDGGVGEAELAQALGRAGARVALRGAEGSGTLSGAGLAQGVAAMEATPGRCGWRAEVVASL